MKYLKVYNVIRVLFLSLIYIIPSISSSPTTGSHEGYHLHSSSSFPLSSGMRYDDWRRIESMDSNGLYLLEWWTQTKDIYFRVTVNTQGFIGLGFSRKSTRMSGSDLVLLWVDDHTGKPNALVSHRNKLNTYKCT